MKTKGYSSLLEVEHYFIKRMADTLLKLNSKVLGWDEVTRGGTARQRNHRVLVAARQGRIS